MILLTGASGFIGKHILRALVEEYGEDKIIAFSSKKPEWGIFVPHLNYNFEPNYLKKSGYSQIHTIIHAGAFTPKNGAEANYIIESGSNILNTQKLLSLDLPSLRKIVFLSTLDVYANIQAIISENTPINPQSLYGHSKYYCESLINTWSRQNDIEHLILRVGHVYGPGEQYYKKLIPEVMRALLRQEKVKIWGKGHDLRSFIYISDVVNSVIASLSVKADGPINVVSDVPVSIKRVVETIIEISGLNVNPEHVSSNHVPRDLVFDNTRLKKQLYEPKIPLEEGLKAEWDAFKTFYAEHNI